MGLSEWIALGSLLLTIVSSVLGMLAWFTKLHNQVTTKLEGIRLEMKEIELAWQGKLNQTTAALDQKLVEGPPWMRSMLAKQDELLVSLAEQTRVALQVARDHGTEIENIREQVTAMEKTSEQILRMLTQN